jgi:hypothetical protein
MLEDGRVMEWANAPVKGVVDGLAVDGSRGEVGEAFAVARVDFALGGVEDALRSLQLPS